MSTFTTSTSFTRPCWPETFDHQSRPQSRSVLTADISDGGPYGVGDSLQAPDPKWGELIDGLLKIWEDTVPHRPDVTQEEPTREAVQTTLQWAMFLKKQCPNLPPTAMVPDGSGGVQMERFDDGALCTISIDSDGRAFHDLFADGKTIYSESLPAVSRELHDVQDH